MLLKISQIESVQNLYFIVLSIYAYGNFITEVVPASAPILSIARGICDAVLIVIGIKFLLRQENHFLKLILSLITIMSSITFYFNSSSSTAIAHLNGLREPIVLVISLAVLTTIFHSPERKHFVARMNKYLMIFLVIQVPVALYQFIRYGAGDLVGGTFSDGGSGMVSQVIFMAVYYFLILRAGNASGDGLNYKKLFPLGFLLIPVFINETKISFIYFAVLIAIQIKIQLNLGKMILSAVTGTIVLLLFVKILAITTDINLYSFTDYDNIESYFFSDWAEADDITRFGKLILTVNDFDEDWSKHIFGAGYGLMKGKVITGSSLAGKEYERLYFGSRMMLFTTYIQGGIALTVIFLFLNFYYFISASIRSQFPNFTRYKLFLLSIFILMWVYNEALFVTYFNMFAVYFLVFIKYGDVAESGLLGVPADSRRPELVPQRS